MEFHSTVLGQLLVIVALSDMPSPTRIATLVSYVDDMKVSQKIQNPNDVVRLLQKLNAIYR